MLKNEAIFQNFLLFFLERYFMDAVQNISKTVKAMPMKFSGILFGIKNWDLSGLDLTTFASVSI